MDTPLEKEMSKYWPKQKPAYVRFIHANNALMECYSNISKSDWETMTKAAMDGKCAAEKAEIKRILVNNELNMTQLVKDRLHFLRAVQPDLNTRDELLQSSEHYIRPKQSNQE